MLSKWVKGETGNSDALVFCDVIDSSRKDQTWDKEGMFMSTEFRESAVKVQWALAVETDRHTAVVHSEETPVFAAL